MRDRFFPALEKSLADQGVDVYSLFLATVMDFISAYIWGIARSTNFIQDKAYREHWLELYKSRNDYPFFPQELPRLTALCKKIGIHLYPTWVDAANKELAEWNTTICKQTLLDLETNKNLQEDADEPVVMKALLNGLDKEGAHGEKSPLYGTAILQRDLSIQSELWDHVLAGQETAGLALTYLTWRLSQHPQLQAELREELLTLQPSARNDGKTRALPDARKLDALPLLHAIVMETLRLHAPIGGPQPREVPFPSARLGPYTIPGGARIAAMAHTLHRDERVYADAEKWDPKRWLQAGDEEARKAMNRQFWAFSSGGRMCIGSNFAMHGTYTMMTQVPIHILCMRAPATPRRLPICLRASSTTEQGFACMQSHVVASKWCPETRLTPAANGCCIVRDEANHCRRVLELHHPHRGR